MALKWPNKDPQERLDYQLDWSARLLTDQIQQSEWAVQSPGLTIGDNSFTVSKSTVWLEGGVEGETYKLTNTIHTTAGRIMEQTVNLRVSQK